RIVPGGFAARESVPSARAREFKLPGVPEDLAQVDAAPCESRTITELFGHAFGLAEPFEHPVELSQRMQGVSKLEAEVDGTGGGGRVRRDMIESLERLLEAGRGFAVRATPRGLMARERQVVERLVPHRRLPVVHRQAPGMSRGVSRVDLFEGLRHG